MKLAVIGCGNMGTAFARSLIVKGAASAADVLLIDKDEERIAQLVADGVGTASSLESLKDAKLDLLLLAVKPQSFQGLAEVLAPTIDKNLLAVSIMAGVTVERIQNALGVERVIRAMPNTPCQIGLGATGFAASVPLSEAENAMLKTLFESTGKVVQVDTEDDVDAVTAVSGSGPAYFYFVVQAMLQAGEKLGLSVEDTKTLVYQTMEGAKALMDGHTGSLDELIAAVKSKGGTTEAALNTFADKGLDDIIVEGMTAAKTRAGELSKM